MTYQRNKEISCIGDSLLENAMRYPHKNVFLFLQEDRVQKVTYSELLEDVKKYVSILRTSFEPNSRVLLLYENTFEFITVFLASKLAGLVPIPMNPPKSNRRDHRLSTILKDSCPEAILTSGVIIDKYTKFLETSADIAQILNLEECGIDGSYELTLERSDDISFIQYTSGSTSVPKGVIISHENLISNLQSMRYHYSIDSESVLCSWLPFYHDMGLVGKLLQTIYTGCTLVSIPSNDFIRKPSIWLKAISDYSVSHSAAPNFAYDHCYNRIDLATLDFVNLSSWKVAVNGSETIRQSSLENFARKFKAVGFAEDAFTPSYGLAEATLFVSGGKSGNEITTLESAEIETQNLTQRDRIVSSGMIDQSLNVVIQDTQSGKILGEREEGEVLLSGPSIMKGYWNKDDSEGFTLVDNESPLKMLQTGDLGLVHNNQLFITGRIKELLIVRGKNYLPYDIEDQLVDQDFRIVPNGVAACTMDVSSNEELVLVVEIKRSHFNEQEAKEIGITIHKTIRKQFGLDAFEIVLLPPMGLPRTSSGKIQRFLALQYLLQNRYPKFFSFNAIRSNSDNKHSDSHNTALFAGQGNIVEEFVIAALLSDGKVDKSELGDLSEIGLASLGFDSIKSLEFLDKLKFELNSEASIEVLAACESIQELIVELNSSQNFNERQIFGHSGEKQEPFPLTKNQEGLWFLEQLDDTGTKYNVPFSVVLFGTIDIEILEVAINKVIDEHPSLRTVFFEEKGTPLQQIKKKCTIKLEKYQSSGNNRDVSTIESSLASIAFDLQNGPLIRALVADFGQDKTLLTICTHHLVIDGWSYGVVLEAILKSYKYLVGNDPNNSETRGSISYADYVEWVQKKDVLDEDTSIPFWKQHLQGSQGKGATFPAIGGDGNKIRNGERMYFSFSNDIAKQVESYCRAQSITPFDFYFSLFNVLLYKYNIGDEFVVGVPYANRAHENLRNLVGYVSNVIPVNTLVEGGMSFVESFKQNAKFHRSALKHQGCPLVDIIKALRNEGEIGTENLFNTLFVFQNMLFLSSDKDNPEGVKVKSAQPFRANNVTENVSSKYDISFQLGYDPDGVFQLEIEYLTALYSRKRIVNLFNEYLRLINLTLLDDSIKIGSVSILSSEESDSLYKNINRTIPRVREKSVVQLLDEAFSRVDPNKAALKFENDSITYGELISATTSLAASIQSEFSGSSGTKIGVLCKRDINAVLSILGILKSGYAYVPIDIAYPKERVEFLIKDASLEFILVDDTGMNILKDLGLEVVAKPINTLLIPKQDVSLRALGDVKDQTAYLIYTSGSTGTPKGVEISHRNVISLMNWAREEFRATPFEILYSPTSYCFDLSVFEYLFPLVQGKTIRILEDVLTMYEFLKMERGVFINTVPSVVKVLLETEADLNHVTAINMAGEVIPGWIKGALDYNRIEVRNLYGPSEDTTYSTCYRFKTDNHSNIPIGKPITGTHLFVVDGDGQLVPEGVEGEICLAGESVSKGYLNRPDLTTRVFVENTFTGGGYLYKTGDIGKILSDGEIGFIGRRDNQIKLRGFRIELGEIKSCLEFLDDVQQAEILVLKDQLGVVWTGVQADSKVLQGELSRKLPAHFLPSFWLRIEKFPTNLNGKLDRKKLEKMVWDSFQEIVEYDAPSTDLEVKMVEIWQTVLGRERIGVRDDFFRLGGHSLLALQVRHLVEEKLHYEITVEEIFSTPTIADLVLLLHAKPLLKVNSIPTLAMVQDERDLFWESIKSKVHIPLDAVFLGYSSVGMNFQEVKLDQASKERIEQISEESNVDLDTVLIVLLQKALWTMARVESIGVQIKDTVSNMRVGVFYQFEPNAGIREQLNTVSVQTSKYIELEQMDKLEINTQMFDDLSIRHINESSQITDLPEKETFLSLVINGGKENTVCIKMRGDAAADEILKLLNNEIIKSINGITEELKTLTSSSEHINKTGSNENSYVPESTSEEPLDFNFNF